MSLECQNPNCAIDTGTIATQIWSGVQQVLQVAAHRQARKQKRRSRDVWQQPDACKATTAFFELLTAYPGTQLVTLPPSVVLFMPVPADTGLEGLL